ncbi:lysosomal cholesterol signaling protein-like isoform X2 [Lineus longissimus]|uniref:lysosomal cholesterol signaling protein-like isoform X2 n=1 Tax=Lineus longissimus TaxID=88925 RepID=UPI00315C56B8
MRITFPKDFNWSQFAAHDPKNKTENLTRAINANLTDEMADDAFDNLYPAIIQCFVVILFGYFAGRINLISHVQAKGLSAYTSNFALPALVFRSMVLLEFSAVDWKFLGSILIAKALVFVVVICFTLVLMRPRNIGKCGLYGIFATQSNDFALGYPIMLALYSETHPEYLKYIYLVAPISFCILNPIGFVLLEIQKRRTSEHHDGGCKVLWHVVKGVITNPIVFMTVIGIIGNFAFSQKVPVVLDGILTLLANSFSSCALFYLGLSLVGKITSQVGTALLTPVLLIFAKSVLLPFAIREAVNILGAGNSTNETASLGSFGFLYGTFPVAPTVLIYASQYNMALDMIATGMVVCTFLSAPLMFVSARMITLSVKNRSDYQDLIQSTAFDVSILGMVCGVWVIGVFVLSRRFRKLPHQLTLTMLVMQFFMCLGNLLYYFVNDIDSVNWQHYMRFIMFLISVLSTRCWTAAIALALCFVRVRSFCFLLRMRVWLFIFALGCPVFITGVLMMAVKHEAGEVVEDPAFQYGQPQIICSAIIIFLCLVTTIVSLVVGHRYDRHRLHSYALLNESTSKLHSYSNRSVRVKAEPSRKITESFQSDSLPSSPDHEPNLSYSESGVGGSGDHLTRTSCEQCPGTGSCAGRPINIEDLVPINLSGAHRVHAGSDASDSPSTSPDIIEAAMTERTCLLGDKCDTVQRRICRKRLRDYDSSAHPHIGDELLEERIGEYQITRHVVLLLLNSLSMFVGLFLCMWRMFNESSSGLYIELEFLDAVTCFGQGFFAFAVFGLDTELVIMPFVRKAQCLAKSFKYLLSIQKVERWRKFVYGVEILHLPRQEDLDEEILHTSHQFNVYHKENCRNELAKDRRWRLRMYQAVFTGTEFVDWLLEAGLAHDRIEAVGYGRRLLLARVLHHVTKEHLFYDLPYFYRFDSDEEGGENVCPVSGSQRCGITPDED